MHEIDFMNIWERLRTSYETHTSRWLGAGMALVVATIIALLVVPGYFSQQKEAMEMLTTGLIALNNDEYVTALQIFDKMERSQRMAKVARFAPLYKGAALFGLERFDQAEASFREFLEKNSHDYLAPEAVMGIAACLEEAGNHKGALAEYRRAQAEYPGSFVDKAVVFQIARLSDRVGDHDAALRIYDELSGDSEGLWRELVRGRRSQIISDIEPGGDTSTS